MTRAAQQHRCEQDAIISLHREADGSKQRLLDRLNRAIRTADELGLRAAEDARHYRDELASGDPLAFAMLRPFAAGICEFIEGRKA